MIEKIDYTDTLSLLKSNLNEFSKCLEAYMDCFKKEDFFDFSLSVQKTLYYKQIYFDFLEKIAALFDLSQKTNAKLSSVLIDLDRCCEAKETEKINRLFSGFKKFEEDFYKYTLQTEKEFSKKQISLNLIFNETKKLKFNTDVFLNEHFKAEH